MVSYKNHKTITFRDGVNWLIKVSEYSGISGIIYCQDKAYKLELSFIEPGTLNSHDQSLFWDAVNYSGKKPYSQIWSESSVRNSCHFETYSMNNRTKIWFQSYHGHYYIYKSDNKDSRYKVRKEIPVCT